MAALAARPELLDHAHTFDLVYHACEELKSLMKPGGFALFHDFNDPRNSKEPDYGAYRAVWELILGWQF